MKRVVLIIVVFILVDVNVSRGQAFSKEQFLNPPIEFWPRPLWFWNNSTVNLCFSGLVTKGIMPPSHQIARKH